MKIIIDTRMQKKGGIGTYITELTKRLDLSPLKIKAPIYSVQEQIAYPFVIPKCDLYFSPHFNIPIFPIRAKKKITTIHDVNHLDHPEHYRKLSYTLAKKLYQKAITNSDQILTVSEYSKSRILHHFPKAQVKVIPLGSDHLMGIQPIKVHKVPNPYYLFVGTHKPHKNRKLLENLPIVDAVGQYTKGQLVWLYKNARALIFPSLYEGFGLPPLEAMSLQCPVLASHAASIPEVCKDGALYFDPKSRISLTRAIEKLPTMRKQLVERAAQIASKKTWDLCAKRHHHLLTQI